MKVRTQVQFEEEQYRALKRLAQESGRSLSELLRQIVSQHLHTQKGSDPWDSAWGLVGLASDREGATDLAVNHDRYLWGD